MSLEWYLLQFKPNRQHQAVKNLNFQKFNTFLPLINCTTRKASRFTSATKPLFPGYMFISLDKTNLQLSKINNTYGVSRLVTFNSRPRSVPQKFIDELMSRCNLSGEILPIKKYKKGDQVKVLNGPFANLIATVETLRTDERIMVLMDLMGRKTKIETCINEIVLSR